MTTNSFSSITSDLNGDLRVQGGQLGLAYEADVPADTDLWTIFQAERYCLNPGAASINIDLPAVGSTVNENGTGVQHGHKIWIKNTSATNELVIRNTGSTTINTIPSNYAAVYQASDNDALEWIIMGVMMDDFVVQTPTTLQNAYDNSGAAVPQILLDADQRGLQIRNTSTAGASEVFRVTNSAGLSDYLNLKTTDGTEVSVEMGYGSTSGTNSVSIGRGANSTGDNSFTVSTRADPVNNTVDDSIMLDGSEHYFVNGGSQVGSPDSDGWSVLKVDKVNGITAAAATNTNIFTLMDNTSYSFKIRVVGRTEEAARSDTHGKTIHGNIIYDSAGPATLQITSSEEFHRPNVTFLNRGTITVDIAAPNLLRLVTQAPTLANPDDFSYHYRLEMEGWSAA